MSGPMQNLVKIQALARAMREDAMVKLRLARNVSTADGGLHRIVDADIHHPQCLVDNCRPSCPIRIAKGTLEMMR